MDDAKLSDEEGRIAALERYCVLDTAPEQPFDRITALVKTVLGAPICAVSLVDRKRQWFKSIQGHDGTETPRDVAFCAHTILAREPLIVPDATLDPRFAGSTLVTGAPFIRAYAGMPLSSPDGYNLGALCVKDTSPRDFGAGEIEILRHFAALVVDELELRILAREDGLTGALTRRAMTAGLDKELTRIRRYDRPGSLVLFDIDHFKAVNDRFGHPVGDQVLKAVGECCAVHLRPSDLFGRMGGEEFAVLLPETGLDEARRCAERLRRTLEVARIGHPQVRFTASFGIAPCGPIDTADKWLAEADAALYAAKRSGRNRCVASTDLLPVAA